MEHKLDEPCVHIYAAMGLYEESVELALKVMYTVLYVQFNSLLQTLHGCRLMLT